jgi:hypothetical protein
VVEVEVPKFTNWMGNFSHVSATMDHASTGGIPIGMSSSNNATVTNVILEHVWVEAAIDYIPSGGRHMVEADTWVALDASFKQYVYLQGLDAIEISGLDVEQLVTDFAATGEYASGPLGRESHQLRDLAAPRYGRVVNKAGLSKTKWTTRPPAMCWVGARPLSRNAAN